jgi:hypothetical protein
MFIARWLLGDHHPTHAGGHAVRVTPWHLPLHETVRVPHAQEPADIKRNLNKTTAGCCVAGIAGVDGLGEGFFEFLVVAILDSALNRLVP